MQFSIWDNNNLCISCSCMKHKESKFFPWMKRGKHSSSLPKLPDLKRRTSSCSLLRVLENEGNHANNEQRLAGMGEVFLRRKRSCSYGILFQEILEPGHGKKKRH